MYTANETLPVDTAIPPVDAAPAAAPRKWPNLSRPLPLPESVDSHRLVWPYLVSIVLLHLIAPLAFVPYFFSWTGVVLCVAGFYVFGTLGINLCYHRLLTHGSFRSPKWLEHTFAILGVCCLQDTPARWVAIHRLHHQHSDERPDPHSPLVAFFWGHVGWLLVENKFVNSLDTYERYARDVLRDSFYFRLERRLMWAKVYLAHAILFWLGGLAAGWLMTGQWLGALQFATSVFLWGVVLRTVLVWHITWSVNSVTHMWGYRNYDTDENSRNNWFVGLVSNGEGWHNNHHADQLSAAHGHRWWELDVTYLTIKALSLVGLATDVLKPRVQPSAPN